MTDFPPKEPPAFSNGSMFEDWQRYNCQRCTKDEDGTAPEGTYCELISLGFMHEVVPEWVADPDGVYGVTCTALDVAEGAPDVVPRYGGPWWVSVGGGEPIEFATTEQAAQVVGQMMFNLAHPEGE